MPLSILVSIPHSQRVAFRLTCTLVAAGVLAGPVHAAVTRLEITAREPYAASRSYPNVGPYEHLRGRIRFAVDPKASANKQVIDLVLAPTNRAGKVEFAADVDILTPKEPGRSNGALLYDVNNRGATTATGMFNGGADDFLMRQGYIVVSSGWIAELLPGNGRLILDAPMARDKKGPLVGKVRAEMAPDAPAQRLNIAHWGNHGSYPPTERGLREATLTYRLREKDVRIAIPRSQFRLEQRYVEADGRKSALPLLECTLEGGFRPGYLYELIYEAEGSLVQGLGLAGIRDLVSFLRHSTSLDNPLRTAEGKPAVRRTIGFGVSQSGRCLRQFLYDGFNADEEGKIVFDGLMPHVAGAGMAFVNHRFASPTRHNAQHDNHLYPADVFPFAYEDETDPLTGRRDGLLRRAVAAKVVPKVMHTQTSAEYWHRSASLVHSDPARRRDFTLPDSVRIYSIAGQHGPGNGIPGPPGSGQLAANPTDYRPVLRALLTSMDRWLREDAVPPPSRYPTFRDGTLTGWRQNESGWKAIPNVAYPEVIQAPEWLDYGPDFQKHRRLTRLPPLSKGSYSVAVPRCGPDGNELGMLQLPTVAVPLGIFTGWNLRSPALGAETELLSLTGAYIPVSSEVLRERYQRFDAYSERFRDEAQRLHRDGYLLDEDLPRVLKLADQARSLLP